MSQFSESRPLHNQVALVTGAGRRIGRAIALELARAGAHVVVNYRLSRSEALTTARDIKLFGVNSVPIRADVARPNQVQKMFEIVRKRFGRLDVLVNNAAIFFRAPWDELGEREWDRILDINLKGTFFCAQAGARIMLSQGRGEIINISSLGGLQAWPGYMHYCASKAAVIMLTKCLAKALAPQIRVNSIAPGTIAFPDDNRDGPAKKLIAATPLRKAGTAQDIAELAVFLAARNRFITGQVFAVDGGKSVL